jgi:hypothetical protein
LVSEIDEDGEIYISEGLEFPCWVSVNAEDETLRVYTYAKLQDNVDELKALQLANRINAKFFPNSVSVINGRLVSYYYVFLDQSISEKNFMKILRRCASAFVSAIREEDSENLI